MKMGSLFDGAGTCCFAAELCGITPVWSSEIEKFPLAVTAKRFPQVKQLGDITKINGAEITPVDIISFGSPCQDLSVAGARKGFDGDRSVLFMEAVRIIKEMRYATANEFPRYAIWENVVGAFSSNGGEDFLTVIEELCKVSDNSAAIPRPTGGGDVIRWGGAGLIMADRYSVAWRVLDAQFWGVPQKRRRIYLVADFGGGRAPEILFKREGLQRHFAESRAAWDETTSSAPRGAHVSGTCYDARGNGDGNIAPTVTGDHNSRASDYSAVVITGVDTYNQRLTGDKGKTVLSGKQDYWSTPCVLFEEKQPSPPLCVRERCGCDGGGKGCLVQTDLSGALTAGNDQFVCLSDASDAECYAIGNGQADQLRLQEKVGALNCMHDEQAVYLPKGKKRLRRLTPLECGRLQGMPDWWCSDVPHSDAAEYKMWGNGMALPNVLYIFEGLAKYAEQQEDV